MAAALDSGSIDLTPISTARVPSRYRAGPNCSTAGVRRATGPKRPRRPCRNSCNIAFAHIALKMGGEPFYEYVRRFGILEKTGIDLAGESKGVFLTRPW